MYMWKTIKPSICLQCHYEQTSSGGQTDFQYVLYIQPHYAL